MKTEMQQTKESQESQILKYMQKGLGITPMHALNKFGCFRLSGRIYDLKQKGYDIETHRYITGSGKIVAKYTLNN